jgi:voltage-gated potassium channel
MLRHLRFLVSYLQGNFYYSLALVLLAILSLLLLGYEFFPTANVEYINLFQNIDIIIAIIFLIDFFAGLFFNTTMTKRAYWSHNWLNLMSSIPITSDVTRVLRILRVIRAIRIIRASMNFWFAKSRYQKNPR